MKNPDIDLKSKIILISLSILMILFARVLLLINGYIWLIFGYLFWLVFLLLIFYIFAKFVKKRKRSVFKVFLVIFMILFLSIYFYPAFLMPISHYKSEANKEELQTIVNDLIQNANTEEEKLKQF